MNLKINNEKLNDGINELIHDIGCNMIPFCSESSICLGKFEGMEIQLIVTKNEDKFICDDSTMSNNYECIKCS